MIFIRLAGLFVIALLLNLTAMAQDQKDSTDRLVAHGSKVFMSSKELDKMEVKSLMVNTDALNIYNQGVKKSNAGTALIVAGAGFITGGAIIAFGGGFYEMERHYYKKFIFNNVWYYGYEDYKKWSIGAKVGVSLMSVGAGCLIVGIPLKFSGKKNIHEAVDMFNYRNAHTNAKLNIGATGNGIGLVLNF